MLNTFKIALSTLLVACAVGCSNINNISFIDKTSILDSDAIVLEELEDVLYKWERQQIRLAYNLSVRNTDDFISLGIGSGKSPKAAKDTAKLNADFNLPEVIKIYVKSVTHLYTEMRRNNEEFELDSEFVNFIFTVSSIKVRDIKYEKLSEITYEEKYYAAVIAKKNRIEYFTDHINFYEYNHPEEIQKFLDVANKRFNELISQMWVQNEAKD